VRVLVVGAGFAGLGAAIRLARSGRRDFLVIDRGPDVGGTWRDNTYPGAACDIPSQLYSFSFAPKREWSRSYSTQPEIYAYLRRVAAESGTLDRFRFGCELLAATWDAAAARWDVRTSTGTFTASILVTAFGALCEPRRPDIDGLDDFAGEVVHSARWPADLDLIGKRVAVIGSGASAIQLVPAIAANVEQLDVYQRTAPWILPHAGHEYSPRQRRLLRLPLARRAVRALEYATREITALGFAYEPRLLAVARRQAETHLQRQVADPVLRGRLRPDYGIGCKRVLISNDWYPALQRDNVTLVTEPIARVAPNSIVTADGLSHEADVLVIATGFCVTDSPAADLVKGADGLTLGEQWREFGQEAYKGTAVAGFPNCFMLIGPNTGLGHTSMIQMIESQLNYLLDALDVIDHYGLATVEVRVDAQDEFNERLQARMKRSVWLTGCRSWYLDVRGRNTTLWPGFTIAFRWITRRFDLEAYDSTATEDR
jgi:cation diffusion facilitator CzcD-associated flavoprotein CzcO